MRVMGLWVGQSRDMAPKALQQHSGQHAAPQFSQFLHARIPLGSLAKLKDPAALLEQPEPRKGLGGLPVGTCPHAAVGQRQHQPAVLAPCWTETVCPGGGKCCSTMEVGLKSL